MAKKGELLYEGKAKRLFKTDQEGILWVEYTDQATAFNGEKKDQLAGKGQLNNQISSLIFEWLSSQGIANHLVEKISDTEQLVHQVQIVPLEVVVRNVAAGSLSKRLGIEEGEVLPRPVLEFYYKDDALGDPLINIDHIQMLALATDAELDEIRKQALRVNEALTGFFSEMGITLVDYKLEFGRDTDGEILLSDEVSPDTCRLWDQSTGNKLDKDVFRRDLGDLIPVYQEVHARLQEKLAK